MNAMKVTLAGAAMLALTPAGAAAQVEDSVTMDLLRACKKIEDVMARVACYDRNLDDGPAASEQAPPAQGPTASAAPRPEPQQAVPAPREARAATGFGSASLQDRHEADDPALDEYRAEVSEAVERAPGIYLLTLADGAQWQFVSTAGPAYEPPRRGSTVEIKRASLGSFLMRYRDQPSIRIRRVQ